MEPEARVYNACIWNQKLGFIMHAYGFLERILIVAHVDNMEPEARVYNACIWNQKLGFIMHAYGTRS